MEELKYTIGKDLLLTKKLLDLTDDELASALLTSRSMVNRWCSLDSDSINPSDIKRIYDFIYSKKINLNVIKSQLYLEEVKNNHLILFHGAKSKIVGEIDINKTKENNDFGQGFYLGNNLKQAMMFVSDFNESSIYIFDFDTRGLSGYQFDVTTEWMIAIAYYRGRLTHYKNSSLVKQIINKVDNADYIIAPIADNKMFTIIESFIDGEITDEQCQHCLSATNLGYQLVIKTNRALKQLKGLERCYITSGEKRRYLNERIASINIGNDKVKVARIQYAHKGLYIDQLFGE